MAELLPLGLMAYSRPAASMPAIRLVNRFLEEDPTDQETATALLSRPATRVLTTIGAGPIRATYSQQGVFGGDLFVVSGQALFRYSKAGTLTPITGTVGGTGAVEMTAVRGPGYEHLFLADGLLLQVYTGTSFARATLTLTPDTPPDIAAQTIQIGTTYYQWTAATPSPTADGTAGAPFEVAVGLDDEGSIINLAAAIDATGIAGLTYSASLGGANTQVRVADEGLEEDALTVQARVRGTGGNSIDVDVTGDHLAWDDTTLTGGGQEVLSGVTVPDDDAAVSLTSLKGYVVVGLAETNSWRWLAPGELILRPLDRFAAADAADNITAVRRLGDELVIFCQGSIEHWYLTGDVTEEGDTWLPVSGRAWSVGGVPGTPVQINRSTILFVGSDDIVYSLSGEPESISNNGISNRVRLAREIEEGL